MSALQQIEHLSDVPVEVEVELDRKLMSVREILALENGSVVKLMRSAGENMILLIGGTPVGTGEIVITEESTGVRITDFRAED
jgi:flagellar motor switch protein FliN/FliY